MSLVVGAVLASYYIVMLAERKSKEKWSQDPRNTFWSKDKSKYGYRMLQQMGWKEKGLGKDEEGRTEHVKVQNKRDCLGVGAKRGRDEDWIQHQDAFDEILAGLNGKQAESAEDPEATKEDKKKTLVENATESKRLVYKRFLRSKDLSVASSEDLDCVLGRKRRKHSSQQDVKAQTTTEDCCSSERDVEATKHGITTVTSSQSVHDYFSSKLSNLKQRKLDKVKTTTNSDVITSTSVRRTKNQ